MPADIDMSVLEQLDWEKIHSLVGSVTGQFRKGEMISKRKVGNVEVTEAFFMPHSDEANTAQVEMIDMVFLNVGIAREEANSIRNELAALLAPAKDVWMAGPSYIHIGAACGDQGRALDLMALGSYLKFWDLLSPMVILRLPSDNPTCRQLAGGGMFFVQGWWPEGKPQRETSPETVNSES